MAAFSTSQTGKAIENLLWRGVYFDPRGGGALRDEDHAFLGRLELDISGDPRDHAWRGTALTNLGSVLYAEQALNLTGKIDNNTIIGAEARAKLFFHTIPFDITIGWSVRLPHQTDMSSIRSAFYIRAGGEAIEQIGVR